MSTQPPSNFTEQAVKGIRRYLLDANLAQDALRLHISAVGPGERVHPPHRHEGVEAFYMLEGEATLDVDGEIFTLGPGEAVIIDTQKLHGISNESTAPMRYLVVRSQTSHSQA
jgi:quercetin dioxygenase-like cupin family protein